MRQHERPSGPSTGRWVIAHLVVILATFSQTNKPAPVKSTAADCPDRYCSSFRFRRSDALSRPGNRGLCYSFRAHRGHARCTLFRVVCGGRTVGRIVLASQPAPNRPPDAIDNLRSAVRAGLTLPEALTQLAERGPNELRVPFEEFAADYRAGARFSDALERLKHSLADPTADRLIASLHVTREVGGADIGRLLETLSDFLRDDARTRAELEARQSWTVNGARLAVVAPWLILLLLVTQPQAAAAYQSVTGLVILLGGVGVSVICYQLMLKIGSLPAERRIL